MALFCKFATGGTRSIRRLVARAGSVVSSSLSNFTSSTVTSTSMQNLFNRQNEVELNYSMQKLTNSLTFVSKERQKFKNWKNDHNGSCKFALDVAQKTTLEDAPAQIETGAEAKRLCVIFGWMLSEKKQLMKYGSIYLDQGFDLLLVRCSPGQFLWPATGGRVIAKDMLTFMENNPQYKTMFLHAFSIGSFVWGQVLVHHRHDPMRYNFLHERLVGQIWDSIAYPEGILPAFRSFMPNNRLLQNLVAECVRLHFNKKSMRKHILETRSVYDGSVLRSPVLIFSSESDPISPCSIIDALSDKWKNLGIEVHRKTWKNSPHVGHMVRHPEEYKTQMKAFLDKLGLLKYPEEFQVKNTEDAVRYE